MQQNLWTLALLLSMYLPESDNHGEQCTYPRNPVPEAAPDRNKLNGGCRVQIDASSKPQQTAYSTTKHEKHKPDPPHTDFTRKKMAL